MIAMWLAFAIILIAILLYMSEWLSMELTSVVTLILLMGAFQLVPVLGADGKNLLDIDRLLHGFGSPALLAILALLVMGQGLFLSGALERPIGFIVKRAGRHPQRALLGVMLCVAGLSAFLNNTPVVLMAIPVMVAILARLRRSVGGHLMALSYIAILGGMVTLIGSSTNLLVAGAAERVGLSEIGLFDQSIPGLVLACVGAVYVLWVMPFIFPNRETSTREDDAQADSGADSGKQYIVEMRLAPDDALVGAQTASGMLPALQGATVQMVETRKGALLPPFDDYTLDIGDRVFVAATRRELSDSLAARAHPLGAHIRGSIPGRADTMLAEAVVAPGSRMVGRSAYQTGFAHDTACHIVGVQRRQRMMRHALGRSRLQEGDILLVAGTQSNIEALRDNRDILVMAWSESELPDFTLANRARWIFGLSILAAVSGLVPIALAAIAGAAGMVAGKVLNLRQAARGLNLQIFLLVGAALAMAEALAVTGGATYLALQFLALFDGQSVAITLSAFFLLCALITNFLSNNATAVLFTPIAINLAEGLGAPVMAFVFAVIFAANCSFLTPIAYQTNLLVLEPGNYKFRDFLRAGAPLLVLLWISYSLFAPIYFNL